MLKSGMLHSLVVRFVRDEEVMGSNPVIPTIKSDKGILKRVPFVMFRTLATIEKRLCRMAGPHV